MHDPISKFALVINESHSHEAEAIKKCAHDLHASVNQFYSKHLPYSFHLDMVADNVVRYADEIISGVEDVLPVYFGAYFHDSIEDARLTYNDVLGVAREYMDPRQALIAAEIVYALTNEKGRTRAERADERYYSGIRTTPYAPMVKLADRLANMTYSSRNCTDNNRRMRMVYASELPHFIASITAKESEDPRLSLPPLMLQAINLLIG